MTVVAQNALKVEGRMRFWTPSDGDAVQDPGKSAQRSYAGRGQFRWSRGG